MKPAHVILAFMFLLTFRAEAQTVNGNIAGAKDKLESESMPPGNSIFFQDDNDQGN